MASTQCWTAWAGKEVLTACTRCPVASSHTHTIAVLLPLCTCRPKKCKEAIDMGLELFQQRKYQEAIAMFNLALELPGQGAYRLPNSPREYRCVSGVCPVVHSRRACATWTADRVGAVPVLCWYKCPGQLARSACTSVDVFAT